LDYSTLLYDLSERVLVRGGKDDVLVGHYCPGDESTVWKRSMLEGEFCIKIAMNPLSYQMAEICGELDPYVADVDSIFGIMGNYWYDTWEKGPLAHWKSKIIPLDMALDIQRFPQVKTRFNPPGRRKFLYIGWSGPQKGTHLLSILFGLAGARHRCVWVGSGPSVPNVEHRPPASFTQEYLKAIASECDFLITMGVSDANPTTVLEAMAWGFPVCCTPQSGYCDRQEVYPLSITDMAHNLQMLDYLQGIHDEELLERATVAREIVARKYTWRQFTEKVLEGLGRVAARKGIRVEPMKSR
jgi:glycosyltransferase involved in cell wall biosynthesis